MPSPYPLELRERAVYAYESGEGTYPAVAAIFGITSRVLQSWVRQYRETNSVAPKPRGGGNRSPVDSTMLAALVAERADVTTHELAAAYNRRAHRSARVHRSSILRALKRAGYVFKKNAFVLQSKSVHTFRKSAIGSSGG